jgi:hypothetical protein
MARSVLVDVLIGAAAGAAATWAMDRATTLLQDRQSAQVTKREKAARRRSTPPPPAVHWAMGIAAGAIYGALRNRARAMGVGSGLAYGTAFFLLVDEAAQAALGFAAPPQAFPWQTHARGLAGHLVLGAVLEAPFDIIDAAA